MSNTIIPGEECSQDLFKCFDFVNPPHDSTSSNILDEHTTIFGGKYYTKYAKVKDNIQVRVYKDTKHQDASTFEEYGTRDAVTELLLEPGTHVHIARARWPWVINGRAEYAVVEKNYAIGNNKEIDCVASVHDPTFEYCKDSEVIPSKFYGSECFKNPSISLLKGIQSETGDSYSYLLFACLVSLNTRFLFLLYI